MSLEIRLQHAIADRRLMTYRPEEILPAVNQILFQTYVLLGFSPPNDRDLGILIAKLAADLQESYPSLTLQEVALCFELGAKGEYGDFMGLNLRTITRWLKCYQTSDLRYRAVVEREQAKSLSALPPVSEAYKEERERAFLRRLSDRAALSGAGVSLPASTGNYPRQSGGETDCHAASGRLPACREYGDRRRDAAGDG